MSVSYFPSFFALDVRWNWLKVAQPNLEKCSTADNDSVICWIVLVQNKYANRVSCLRVLLRLIRPDKTPSPAKSRVLQTYNLSCRVQVGRMFFRRKISLHENFFDISFHWSATFLVEDTKVVYDVAPGEQHPLPVWCCQTNTPIFGGNPTK